MPEARVWYRPALDGVRALAVAAVLLFHARVPGTTGGFLGIDVFFVLSGFLITSLLLHEHAETGRIDLPAFWARRARRLLPALFAMLISVAVYAAWLAPDVSRLRLPGDVAAALVYVANWRFVLADPGYFEQYGDPSPVLHTWSLAVEEQFYLVWPLLVVAALRWVAGRPGASRRGRRRTAVLALAAAITTSAALTWWLSADPVNLSRAYYGTDTRAQELLVGALLSLLARQRGWWSTAPGSLPRAAWLDGVGVAAVGCLVALVIGVHDPVRWLHAGGQLLVSLLAAALLLVAVHPARSWVSRALSWRPLVLVGVVSYGLYVWHWPVNVVLDPNRTGLTGAALIVIRLAVAGALAAVSYRLVERPVRRGAFWTAAGTRGRREAPVLVGAAAGLTCLVAVLMATSGAGMSEAARAAAGPDPLATAGAGSAGAAGGGPGPAGIGSGVRPLSVFVLGDSTAFGLFAEFPPPPSLNLHVSGSAQLGCDILGGSRIIDGKESPPLPQCANWPKQWPEAVRTMQPDIALFMLGNLELFDHQIDGRRLEFGSPAYEATLRGLYDQVFAGLHAGTSTVAVTTLPCFHRSDTGFDSTAAIVNDPRRQAWLNAVLARYVADHPGVAHVLDLRGYLCPGDRYQEDLQGVRLHKDGVHWTKDGSALVWTWLAPRLAAAAGRPAAR